ncbi:hypothetical protein M8J77_017748 [Diaphorina citri]|nr:hypothetical protein M8J77_017748 [Diaphorina citri]
MSEISISPIIQTMLFGLGDCRKPQEATSCIIEEHLQQQLDFIVYKAHACSGNSESEEITVRNILFLLRNNPVRLQRVYQYFDLKSKRQEITGAISGTATTNKDIAADLKSCFFTGTKKSRNVNVKQLILEFLDEFKIKIDGEFIDEAKHERLLRQNELSIEHSKEDYLVYEKSRSVSFDSWKHQREFNEWLGHKLKNNPGVSLLTPTSYELLQYLAKEIIAQIIDYAILLRNNAKSQSIKNSDLTSTGNEKVVPRPEAAVFPIMPDEVNEVMRRCQYTYMKPYQSVLYCIIF